MQYDAGFLLNQLHYFADHEEKNIVENDTF